MPIYPTSFAGLPDASGVQQVDVVTAFHVLEHLPVPQEFARFSSQVLRPGGLLAVEIPNLFSFESLYFRDSWHGLALPAHLGFYTPKSLETLFQPSFRIVLLEYSIAAYFHENIADYAAHLAVDRQLIDGCARQFSGTAMVAYLERVDPEQPPRAGQAVADAIRRTLPYRAARKVWRKLKRRR